MPVFEVPVRQLIAGDIVLIKMHKVTADNFKVAQKIVALGTCDGRFEYSPDDERPYASGEGWREITNNGQSKIEEANVMSDKSLRPYLFLAEQLSFNGISTERLERIGSFVPGKNKGDIHKAVEISRKRHLDEEITLFSAFAEELQKIFILNEEYIIDPTF